MTCKLHFVKGKGGGGSLEAHQTGVLIFTSGIIEAIVTAFKATVFSVAELGRSNINQTFFVCAWAIA
ncbi:hypothetical protein KC353_g62 [Hortaea werneckii]|nr:hypothetical protein KC353_g62 [Hortaea werneckii]